MQGSGRPTSDCIKKGIPANSGTTEPYFLWQQPVLPGFFLPGAHKILLHISAHPSVQETPDRIPGPE